MKITNEEQDGNNVILTLESEEKVTMSDDEYESMITSGLDEMLGDMFPESMRNDKHASTQIGGLDK